MDRKKLSELLNRFKAGEIGDDEILEYLADFPIIELGYANINSHRALRQGFPEVVFGLGKRPEQVLEIVSRLAAVNDVVLATKVDDEASALLKERFPEAKVFTAGRAVIIRSVEHQPAEIAGSALIISAGTSDSPVAEEAAATLEAMDIPFQLAQDVGIAGVHRLLKYKDLIRKASVIIVIAGMEGALASLVGGLTGSPVIAVPTSVGYGASFGGIAALLGMLNSCVSGVTVVNIDNGFGAACAAAKIIKIRSIK